MKTKSKMESTYLFVCKIEKEDIDIEGPSVEGLPLDVKPKEESLSTSYSTSDFKPKREVMDDQSVDIFTSALGERSPPKSSNCESLLKARLTCTAATDRSYKCKVCEYKCSSEGDLKKHKFLHASDNSRKCSICKRSIRSNLKRHMLTHISEKQHECSICNRKFTQKSSFKRHLLIHTNEQSYKCNICSYKSAYESSLNMHMYSHTDEKPYECNVCNRKFALKWRLKRHFLIHTGEKAHECNICNYKFSMKSHVIRHMRTAHS